MNRRSLNPKERLVRICGAQIKLRIPYISRSDFRILGINSKYELVSSQTKPLTFILLVWFKTRLDTSSRYRLAIRQFTNIKNNGMYKITLIPRGRLSILKISKPTTAFPQAFTCISGKSET